MRLRHPLIHHGPAATADQAAAPAAQESVFLVGHQRLAVLPAQAQVVAPAVLASLDWNLIGCHGHPSLLATHNTTETENSQGHGELLSNCYQFLVRVSIFLHWQRPSLDGHLFAGKFFLFYVP